MGTALVLSSCSRPQVRTGFAGERPHAEFLAQLIAARLQAPQTRLRRRAEPEDAVAVYAVSGRVPRPSGRVLSRSL